MIETYNESDLHKSLKNYFTPADGEQEVKLAGSVCDILCRSGKIIEIQTANLNQLKIKMEKFLKTHNVEIVFPIIENNFIRMLNADLTERSYRKSPKHNSYFQIYREITGIYYLVGHKRLTLTLPYIDAETVKIDDGLGRSRRKRPRTVNRKLLKINKIEKINSLNEFIQPVVKNLPNEFTTKDIKSFCPAKYASYALWFLRKRELVELVRKDGRTNIWTLKTKFKN